ncbi:keratinocyte differentiation factor 1 isoform 1-T2 [Menidia menidia]
MSTGSSGSLRRSSGSFHQERCVDPVVEQPTREHGAVYKARLEDANGKESETIGFIPGSAEPSSSGPGCNPCASPGGCKTVVCSVLTCGLYRVCQGSILTPCLAPDESSPDEREKASLQGEKPGNSNEDDVIEYPDLHINGVKVVSPRKYVEEETKSPSYVPPAGLQTQQGYPSLHEPLRFDDWDDGDEDVDSLITKKLLELYSEYQIEELARCTSDSVFLRKSKAINQLINSLAEEHKMDEQEAECRLVRGIIRISTRKSAKKRPVISKVERTPSDSGNETMIGSGSFSFGNNNDYRSNPNIQISELTPSDEFAREIWRKNGGHPSSSSTAYSHSHTETDSSGVPLIHTSVRT